MGKCGWLWLATLPTSPHELVVMTDASASPSKPSRRQESWSKRTKWRWLARLCDRVGIRGFHLLPIFLALPQPVGRQRKR